MYYYPGGTPSPLTSSPPVSSQNPPPSNFFHGNQNYVFTTANPVMPVYHDNNHNNNNNNNNNNHHHHQNHNTHPNPIPIPNKPAHTHHVDPSPYPLHAAPPLPHASHLVSVSPQPPAGGTYPVARVPFGALPIAMPHAPHPPPLSSSSSSSPQPPPPPAPAPPLAPLLFSPSMALPIGAPLAPNATTHTPPSIPSPAVNDFMIPVVSTPQPPSLSAREALVESSEEQEFAREALQLLDRMQQLIVPLPTLTPSASATMTTATPPVVPPPPPILLHSSPPPPAPAPAVLLYGMQASSSSIVGGAPFDSHWGGPPPRNNTNNMPYSPGPTTTTTTSSPTHPSPSLHAGATTSPPLAIFSQNGGDSAAHHTATSATFLVANTGTARPPHSSTPATSTPHPSSSPHNPYTSSPPGSHYLVLRCSVSLGRLQEAVEKRFPVAYRRLVRHEMMTTPAHAATTTATANITTPPSLLFSPTSQTTSSGGGGGPWKLYASTVLQLQCFRYSSEDYSRCPSLACHITPSDLRCYRLGLKAEDVLLADAEVGRLLWTKYLRWDYLMPLCLQIIGDCIHDRSVAYGVPPFVTPSGTSSPKAPTGSPASTASAAAAHGSPPQDLPNARSSVRFCECPATGYGLECGSPSHHNNSSNSYTAPRLIPSTPGTTTTPSTFSPTPTMGSSSTMTGFLPFPSYHSMAVMPLGGSVPPLGNLLISTNAAPASLTTLCTTPAGPCPTPALDASHSTTQSSTSPSSSSTSRPAGASSWSWCVPSAGPGGPSPSSVSNLSASAGGGGGAAAPLASVPPPLLPAPLLHPASPPTILMEVGGETNGGEGMANGPVAVGVQAEDFLLRSLFVVTATANNNNSNSTSHNNKESTSHKEMTESGVVDTPPQQQQREEEEEEDVGTSPVAVHDGDKDRHSHSHNRNRNDGPTSAGGTVVVVLAPQSGATRPTTTTTTTPPPLPPPPSRTSSSSSVSSSSVDHRQVALDLYHQITGENVHDEEGETERRRKREGGLPFPDGCHPPPPPPPPQRQQEQGRRQGGGPRASTTTAAVQEETWRQQLREEETPLTRGAPSYLEEHNNNKEEEEEEEEEDNQSQPLQPCSRQRAEAEAASMMARHSVSLSHNWYDQMSVKKNSLSTLSTKGGAPKTAGENSTPAPPTATAAGHGVERDSPLGVYHSATNDPISIAAAANTTTTTTTTTTPTTIMVETQKKVDPEKLKLYHVAKEVCACLVHHTPIFGLVSQAQLRTVVQSIIVHLLTHTVQDGPPVKGPSSSSSGASSPHNNNNNNNIQLLHYSPTPQQGNGIGGTSLPATAMTMTRGISTTTAAATSSKRKGRRSAAVLRNGYVEFNGYGYTCQTLVNAMEGNQSIDYMFLRVRHLHNLFAWWSAYAGTAAPALPNPCLS